MSDTIDFDCPHCGMRYGVTRDYIASFGGQETTCSACQRTLTIPPASMLPAFDTKDGALLSNEGPHGSLARVSGIWRDGKVLVMERGRKLPRRCPKCNGEVVRFRRLDFTMSYRGYRGSLFLRLATDETASIKVGLCARHDRSWQVRTYIGPLALVCAGLLFATGFLAGHWLERETMSDILEVCATLLAIAAIGWLVFKFPLLWPIEMDRQHLYLRGASEEFLAELPDLTIAGEVAARRAADRLQEPQ